MFLVMKFVSIREICVSALSPSPRISAALCVSAIKFFCHSRNAKTAILGSLRFLQHPVSRFSPRNFYSLGFGIWSLVFRRRASDLEPHVSVLSYGWTVLTPITALSVFVQTFFALGTLTANCLQNEKLHSRTTINARTI